ncbi:unnamed protein product [Sphenostylis stenocarpa]|uniref:DUF7356 domain-containing protein n=1 Tax=Sphenostylis stenocarpa TaxID=92480 RepID=A0AA86V8W8_9FABA|nr:unnamed protein product [Sphenostylis stenocarpa]
MITMRTNVLLLLLLLPMIMSDVSDASFVLKLRKLIAPDPNDTKTKDPNPVGEMNKVNRGGPVSPVPQPQPLPKVVNADDKHTYPVPPSSVPPLPVKDDKSGNKVKNKEKETNEGKLSHSTTTKTCEGFNTCTDDGDMLACISKNDPKYLVVLLHNKGDGIIKVKLRTDFENNLGDVEVDKSKTEEINITRSSGESTQLTLNAGKGDCVLHLLTHIPENNFFLHLPSYDKILTPVNGAYFLILMVLIFGATWACCACRKKRQDEIPYQELEMALPESASATNVESAQGWDQDWDDDWDDNVAVKSPAALAASISANGLTSRSSNKDGWENNWDD